jgi:hypothetical protein
VRPGQRLVSELRGDLDGIVMKAMEKNRDRRYDTVFVYHNGAESYYAARGFRGSLRV